MFASTPGRAIASLLLLLVGAGATTQAHHSFAGVYDQGKPLRVQGVVEAVKWASPHVTLVVVVSGASETAAPETTGPAVRWTFEMGAPGVLVNQFGWTPQTVQAGDAITIEGFRARDGSQQAAAVTITTRTGARLRAVRPFR